MTGMVSARVDLPPIIKEFPGGDYRYGFDLLDENDQPIDLTGYTAKMHIRDTIDAEIVVVDLTTENGGIILTTGAGEIVIGTSTINALTLKTRKFDFWLIPPGQSPVRLFFGDIPTLRSVTRNV